MYTQLCYSLEFVYITLESPTVLCLHTYTLFLFRVVVFVGTTVGASAMTNLPKKQDERERIFSYFVCMKFQYVSLYVDQYEMTLRFVSFLSWVFF